MLTKICVKLSAGRNRSRSHFSSGLCLIPLDLEPEVIAFSKCRTLCVLEAYVAGVPCHNVCSCSTGNVVEVLQIRDMIWSDDMRDFVHVTRYRYLTGLILVPCLVGTEGCWVR